ncbi:MAG: SDR family NAD(P)-dependent oxidoreductase [Flavobacterium sp.]
MKKNGNTILITGGSAGIGLALAEKFLNEGNEVIICGRTKATLDKVQKRLPKINTIVADVSLQVGREVVTNEITNRFPKLNVLVNNAGIYSITDFNDTNYISNLEAQLATNLVAPIALMQQLLPILEKVSEATVVNITSGYVFIPSAQSSGYSASKSGLRAITQGLRFKLRNSKIKVVEVIPPAVDTQMNKGKNLDLMTTAQFAERTFKGLVNNQEEIVIGISKVGKLLSRLAPKFGFNKMNTDEAKQ